MNQYFARVQLAGDSPGPRAMSDASGIGRSMGWGVYQLFETADAKQIFIAATTNRHWQKLCVVLELPELATDPALSTNALRSRQRPLFIPQIAAAVRRLSLDEVMTLLREANPYAPVNTPADLVGEPHLNDGAHLVDVRLSDGRVFKQPTLPIDLGDARFEFRLPPPALGEHTDQILAELGYQSTEIEQLRATGAVVSSQRMLGIDTEPG
jgi:crotonobetainyl-CoA:carnitine CoA-transferase CaiB-like acyl-CoA transferase